MLSGYVTRWHPDRPTENPDNAAARAFAFNHVLETEVSSPKQPFERAHASTELALANFKLSRAQIARQLGLPIDLSITSRQARIITGEDTTLNLEAVYELEFPPSGSLTLPSEDLVIASGLSHAELKEALQSHFVSNDGAEKVTFKAVSGTVQNEREEIQGLTRSILDRLHRFTRLKQQTRWSVRELDLLVEHAGGALDRTTLNRLLVARRVAERLGLDVETLCCVLGDFPARSAGSEQAASPGVRRFGLSAPLLPSDALVYDATNTALIARLMRGLQLDEASLRKLVEAIQGGATTLSLGPPTLGSLVRHSVIARGLRLGIGDLFRALRLASLGDVIHGETEAIGLIEWIEWQRQSPWSLAEIEGMLAELEVDEDDPAATELAALASAEGRLTFTDTVFALAPGITEAQSRALIQANLDRFQSVGTLYQLAEGFDINAPLDVGSIVDASRNPTSGRSCAPMNRRPCA